MLRVLFWEDPGGFPKAGPIFPSHFLPESAPNPGRDSILRWPKKSGKNFPGVPKFDGKAFQQGNLLELSWGTGVRRVARFFPGLRCGLYRKYVVQEFGALWGTLLVYCWSRNLSSIQLNYKRLPKTVRDIILECWMVCVRSGIDLPFEIMQRDSFLTSTVTLAIFESEDSTGSHLGKESYSLVWREASLYKASLCRFGLFLIYSIQWLWCHWSWGTLWGV